MKNIHPFMQYGCQSILDILNWLGQPGANTKKNMGASLFYKAKNTSRARKSKPRVWRSGNYHIHDDKTA